MCPNQLVKIGSCFSDFDDAFSESHFADFFPRRQYRRSILDPKDFSWAFAEKANLKEPIDGLKTEKIEAVAMSRRLQILIGSSMK